MFHYSSINVVYDRLVFLLSTICEKKDRKGNLCPLNKLQAYTKDMVFHFDSNLQKSAQKLSEIKLTFMYKIFQTKYEFLVNIGFYSKSKRRLSSQWTKKKTSHTTYSRNNMGQKCEGNCGLWVLNEIILKKYPENLKKIVGAVWELPSK